MITLDGEYGVRAARLPEFHAFYPDARDFGWTPCPVCVAERAAHARWINAGIPQRYAGMTFESFDCLTDRQKRGKEQARQMAGILAGGENIDLQGVEKSSLLLLGDTGQGKSCLMSSIAQLWIEREVAVLWADASELIDAIRHSYEDPEALSADSIIERAQNVALLCLDDLGDMEREAKVTDHTRDKIYAIVRHRHTNNMPTVFTSNLMRPAMEAQFGKRITDRIYEMAHDVRLRGENLRFPNKVDLRIAANE